MDALEENKFKKIKNVAYQSHLNAIEHVWYHAKKYFREALFGQIVNFPMEEMQLDDIVNESVHYADAQDYSRFTAQSMRDLAKIGEPQLAWDGVTGLAEKRKLEAVSGDQDDVGRIW